ncbi:non-ribosomal peptide synthetase [Verrucosispora sp. WMMD1129]|uniref:amino acid adenylation domain-containing protein n=1 Tax=Verrucosispora sp. WMMD1129 TaxID=3016093 RepID=UPI00249A0532|nr:non-ribosomal peptide synthetase [Verrucosispora sp. WMMD1129]WFE47893.1 amino acid adenylation domain-containing protein [Verrucosispora sp. WMMD1129]
MNSQDIPVPSVGQARSLVAGFGESVRCFPDRVAVRCGGRGVTFAELDRRVGVLAGAIRAAGVDVSRPVGVLLDRSVDMVAAVLAVLRVGSSYVPLDVGTPAGRLELIVDDADPSVVVTSGGLVGLLPEGVPSVLVDDEGVVGGPVDVAVAESGGDDRAYVIFTSGTTGRPKGVQISHGNVLRLFGVTERHFGFGPDDVWAMFHSFAFDFSVWEMWGPLLYGGCLVIVPRETAQDPRALWDLLEQERVSVLCQTPTAFNQLIAEDATRGRRLPLRWVIFGGEALHFADLRPWVARYGDEQPQLINMYGITETTVHATYRRVRRDDLDQGRSLIGVPLADLRFTLVDADLNEVPAGEVGEIIVTGPGVSAGYLGRPELDAERFVRLPGSTARSYRSGDQAVLVESGEYEYRGRQDDQVKIRGFRIELGEVHAAFAGIPGVRQVVVTVVRPETAADPVLRNRTASLEITDVRDLLRGESRRAPSPSTGPRIVAHLVADDDLDPGELFTRLRGRLPNYMMPSFIVPVDAIPLTQNGKVDRDRLPTATPANSLRESRPVEAAGQGNLVTLIRQIFAEVLGVPSVGSDDSFFSVGGDSITALRLRARAQERGVTLNLVDIYGTPTPAGLAALAGTAQAPSENRPPTPPFSLISAADRAALPDGVTDAYPVSTLQGGLLFHSAYDADVNMYCDIFMFRLRAGYDHRAMEQAVARAVARHEILRTSFTFTDHSQPLQLVHPSAPSRVTVVDLRHLGGEEQDAELSRWQLGERQTGYDWSVAPLMRYTVHLLSADEFQFSVSFHDALLDGWSESSLITEILSDYWQLRAGDKPVAAPPRRRYADFIALEQETLRDPSVHEFWARELSGAEPTLLPRNAVATGTAARNEIGFLSVEVDADLSAALDELAARCAVSLKHVLLAVHARVLATVTGRSDLVLGVESNGRVEEEGGAEVIGVHLNLLPYRLATSGTTWMALIRAAYAKEQQLLPVRRFPYAELQRLNGGRELTDVSFNYTHFHSYEQLASATSLTVVDAKAYIQTHFALRTEFNKDPFTKLLSLDLEADLHRLSEPQVRLIAALYRHALADAVAHPETVPSRRTLLGETYWQELVAAFGPPARPLSAPGYFTLLEQSCATHAEALAVRCGEDSLTYAELAVRIERIAARLARRAVTAGTVVGMSAARGIDSFVTALAAMRIGAIYLPLPSGPPTRVASMLRTSQAALVLGDRQSEAALREAAGPTPLLLLDELVASGDEHDRYAGPLPGGRAAAYVIFTSGSTGEPKGATIRHDGMLNHLEAKIGTLGISAGDLVSQDAAATFDISIWQMLAPLAVGATSVIYPDEISQDPSRLLRAVAEDGITVLEVSPTVLSVFSAELTHYGLAAFPPFRLRWVVSSGETLTPKSANAFRRHLPQVRLLNMWGATEVSDDCTHYEIIGWADERAASVPVGRPIDNAKVYVLDEHREPVPTGTPGELYVGGLCVGAGYVNDVERTAAAFVPDPIAEQPGIVAYRTGDRGRLLPDGNLEFLGRIDKQVKIRGHRVELAEVEGALAAIPTLQESVVIVRSDGEHGNQLVAFFVPQTVAGDGGTAAGSGPSRAEVSPLELREQLAAILPRYAVPDHLVRLDVLPRTPHGKVDTRSLAGWQPAPPPELTDDLEPGNETEAVVMDVWRSVLRLSMRPGPLTDFFGLGGHSLHAAQVMARLRDRFGMDLPIRLLFENPNPRALAQRIASGRGVVPATDGTRIRPAQPRPDRFPLAANQAALWFLCQVDPDDRSYDNTVLLHLSGALDITALRSAITTLTSRHEVFSMRFGTEEGSSYQRPDRDAVVTLDVVDATGEQLTDPTEMTRYVRDQVLSDLVLDLTSGPVVVTRLFRFTPTEHVLQWSSHHLVSDGWSTNVVFSEITEAYRAHRQGLPPQLPELPIQYADYALWRHERAAATAGADVDFWRDYLDGYSGDLGLVTDFPRTEERSREAGYVAVRWPTGQRDRVQRAAEEAGVTTFMLLHSAAAIVLSRFAQHTDIVLAAPVAGRDLAETENLVGYFADTLPFRYRVEPQATGAALVDAIAASALSALDHQQLSFQEIVRAARPPRVAGMPTLVQAMVAVDNYPLDLRTLPEVTGRLVQLPPATALFDLLFRFVFDPEPELSAQYDATLFTRATIDRLLAAIGRALEFLVTHPDMKLSEMRLIDQDDQTELERLWREISGDDIDLGKAAAQIVESPSWPDFLAAVQARQGLLAALLLAF